MKKFYKIGVMALTLFLTLTMINFGGIVLASEPDISFESIVEISEDKSFAKVNLSAKYDETKIELLEVKDPSGQVMENEKLEWRATQSGDYSFTYRYQETTQEGLKEKNGEYQIRVKEFQLTEEPTPSMTPELTPEFDEKKDAGDGQAEEFQCSHQHDENCGYINNDEMTCMHRHDELCLKDGADQQQSQLRAGDVQLDLSQGSIVINTTGAYIGGVLVPNSNTTAQYRIQGDGGSNTIQILKDCTVTLSGMKINTQTANINPMTINANVTLLIEGTNEISVNNADYAGILVSANKKLIVDSINNGTTEGTLNLTGISKMDQGFEFGSAAIGSNLNKTTAGTIEMKGGSFQVNGFSAAAGDPYHVVTASSPRMSVSISGGNFSGVLGKDGSGTLARGNIVSVQNFTSACKGNLAESKTSVTVSNITGYGSITSLDGDANVIDSRMTNAGVSANKNISVTDSIFSLDHAVTSSDVGISSTTGNIKILESNIEIGFRIYGAAGVSIEKSEIKNTSFYGIDTLYAGVTSATNAPLDFIDSKLTTTIKGVWANKNHYALYSSGKTTVKNSEIYYDIQNADNPSRALAIYAPEIVYENSIMVGNGAIFCRKNGGKVDISGGYISSTNTEAGIYSMGDINISGGYLDFVGKIEADQGTMGALSVGPNAGNKTGDGNPIIFASGYVYNQFLSEIEQGILFTEKEGRVYGPFELTNFKDNQVKKFTIPEDYTLHLEEDASNTYKNPSLLISNSGTLEINQGRLIIADDKTVTLNNGEIITTDSPQSAVENFGNIEALGNSKITNKGLMENHKDIEVKDNASLTNEGKIVNYYQAGISNDPAASLANTGEVYNAVNLAALNKDNQPYLNFNYATDKDFDETIAWIGFLHENGEISEWIKSFYGADELKYLFAKQGENRITLDFAAMNTANNQTGGNLQVTDYKFNSEWKSQDLNLDFYTLRFDENKNNPSSQITTKIALNGDSYSKYIPNYTRPDYQLKEWNELADGSGTVLDLDAVINESGAKTYYAIWTEMLKPTPEPTSTPEPTPGPTTSPEPNPPVEEGNPVPPNTADSNQLNKTLGFMLLSGIILCLLIEGKSRMRRIRK